MIEPFLKRHGGVLVLFAAYLLSLLIVDPRGNFPLNDDWVYARGCLDSARAGRLELTRLESAWSFPQIILGSLAAKAFGFSHTAFRASGIVALALSALLLDAYLRRLGLSTVARSIAVGTWIFNPVAYILGLSFMTDLPFMLLWLAACYCWDMAIATEKRRWLALAAITTMIATAQRQPGVLIPVAACLIVFVRLKWGSRRLVLSISLPTKASAFQWSALAAVVAIFLGFLGLSIWRAGVGAHRTPFVEVTHTSREYLLATYRMALFAGLSSIPFLPILARPVLSRRSAWIAGGFALAASIFGIAFLAKGKTPLFGNLFSDYGLFSELDVLWGTRKPIFGSGWIRAFDLLGLLGILGMIWRLCGAFRARRRTVEPDSSHGEIPCSTDAERIDGFGGVLVLAGALIVPIFIVRGQYFDRYLLPALPAVWVALAMCGAARSRVRSVASLACLAALAAFSITIACDYFRWNEARWEAAERLVRKGVPAQRIRGGYEWFGTYGGPDNGIGSHPSRNASDFDYVVSFSGRIEGFGNVGAIPWKSIWPPHHRRMHVLKNRQAHDPRN